MRISIIKSVMILICIIFCSGCSGYAYVNFEVIDTVSSSDPSGSSGSYYNKNYKIALWPGTTYKIMLESTDKVPIGLSFYENGIETIVASTTSSGYSMSGTFTPSLFADSRFSVWVSKNDSSFIANGNKAGFKFTIKQ
jgi:hypothetical protein